MESLSKKEVVLSIIIPFVTFVLGIVVSFMLSRFVPESEDKIIRNNKVNGYNQQQIRKLPYINAFLEYLSYIEKKDTTQIWNHMAYSFRKSFGTPKSLLYLYYLTNCYEMKYIIPISEGHFYVCMKFEDDMIYKEVKNLKKFNNTQLRDIIKDTLPKALQKEVFCIIDSRFDVDSPEYVKKEIYDYMLGMTMNEYVTQDWRFPMIIASKLQLEPKNFGQRQYDYRNGHNMVCDVEMSQEDGIWKVKKFETIAIARWK